MTVRMETKRKQEKYWQIEHQMEKLHKKVSKDYFDEGSKQPANIKREMESLRPAVNRNGQIIIVVI